MSAALAMLAREVVPRHLPKWYARVLGVSVRTGKLYSAHPELFPASRSEQLLIALEREETRLEARRIARAAKREALKREIRAALRLDSAGLDLDRAGIGAGLDSGESVAGGVVLPCEGAASEVAPAAGRDARR